MGGVPQSRTAAISLACVVFAWFGLPAGATLEREGPGPPGGRAIDTLGNVLEGVEILIVDPAAAARPVASAVTDAAGRFRIPALPPDVYRVAALKDGYLTAVATFDTSSRSWIDVMLHPRPEAGTVEADRLPADPAWVLRAPRRSVLRELDDRPEAWAADAPGDDAPEAGVIDAAWGIRVDQTFALATDVGDADDRTPGGSETLVRVDSSIGRRGTIQVDGRRTSHDSFVDGRKRAAVRDAGSLALALSYDTSLDSTLMVEAYYDRADLSLDAPAATSLIDGGLATGFARKSSSWGYDARWQTQLDARSSLQVSMDYRGGSLKLAGGVLPDGDLVSDESVHALEAGGRYESLPAAGHRLSVDFGARVDSVPDGTNLLPAAPATASSRVPGMDGIRIGLDARDSWFLGGPVSVQYGLGYRHELSATDAALIVPRLGGTLSTHAAMLRVMVAYHSVAGADEDSPSPTYRPEEPIGWETELEVPLGDGVSVRGAASYAPIQLERFAGGGTDVRGDPSIPLFVSDGNASIDRRSIALVKDAGGTRTFVEMETGEAAGTLAAFVPFDIVPREITERTLRFRTGRLGVRLVESGTDLLLEYRRVAESSPLDPTVATVEQHALELRLGQELMRRPTIGHWRLLIGLRAASVDSAESEVAAARSSPPPIDPIGHRVSAGLSVLF